MSKAYSNKALPSGTVLREWRLEEVLGVGGFGIVYKGRGIYFDELVAIKEYFPSSISERDADDTVVPIDSDAEEVHALGLKKFVEEAKLLWNLSTPTRHPNIVSVRSLFEIHGTAYMVMDFEDGIALSRMLKQGAKFNERSLWNIIRPVAEGLDRAHRVGVLHRDIKPPNILINEDGRPVLIDFGSARFEAAEATSTKVTFHTPPYAAIEQYVKTYPQGPWTDIYALGVVLYECVTGTKPPEVLERMHGGKDEKLADKHFPGYSHKFLEAIDAAMTIRPQERPQSISEWLDVFGKMPARKTKAPAVTVGDDDATRVYTHELASENIVPVAPPETGLADGERIPTAVPTDPNAVVFKGAGHETGAKKKAATVAAAAAATAIKPEEAKATPEPAAAPAAAETPQPEKKAPPTPSKAPADAAAKRKPSPALLGGAAVALVAAAVGGWAILGRSGDQPSDVLSTTPEPLPAPTTAKLDPSMLAPTLKALADDATKAGAPLAATTALTQVSDQLAQQFQSLQPLKNNPSQAAALEQRESQMDQLATKAASDFAAALLKEAETKTQRLAAAVPWANPNDETAASSQPQERQQVANDLRTSLGQLRSAVNAAGQAASPAQAIDYARMALNQSQNFTSASLVAYNKQETTVATAAAETPKVQKPTETVVKPTAKPTAVTTKTPTQTAAAEPASSATTLSPAKISQLNSIVDDGRSMAKDVMRMGKRGSDPASSQTLKANAQLARTYDQNLAALKDSGRGARSDRDADRLIAQAKQTRAYVQFLFRQSSGLAR